MKVLNINFIKVFQQKKKKNIPGHVNALDVACINDNGSVLRILQTIKPILIC